MLPTFTHPPRPHPQFRSSWSCHWTGAPGDPSKGSVGSQLSLGGYASEKDSKLHQKQDASRFPNRQQVQLPWPLRSDHPGLRSLTAQDFSGRKAQVLRHALMSIASCVICYWGSECFFLLTSLARNQPRACCAGL